MLYETCLLIVEVMPEMLQPWPRPASFTDCNTDLIVVQPDVYRRELVWWHCHYRAPLRPLHIAKGCENAYREGIGLQLLLEFTLVARHQQKFFTIDEIRSQRFLIFLEQGEKCRAVEGGRRFQRIHANYNGRGPAAGVGIDGGLHVDGDLNNGRLGGAGWLAGACDKPQSDDCGNERQKPQDTVHRLASLVLLGPLAGLAVQSRF